MKQPTIMSREGLHPLWSDLHQQAEEGRQWFRDNLIDEGTFRARMKRLGFSWSEIQAEVAFNKPTVRP